MAFMEIGKSYILFEKKSSALALGKEKPNYLNLGLERTQYFYYLAV